MKRIWVLGAGGMLGAAVTRYVSDTAAVQIYRYPQPMEWKQAARLQAQFHAATPAFLQGLGGGDEWQIYWAAGVGAMGASPDELEVETTALATLLTALQSQLQQCPARGVVAYASSAGALYAGCDDFEITEDSTLTVGNAYARAKLRQEKMLQDFVGQGSKVSLLLARFSTLYGPGQAQSKRQGLLTHIARCALRQQPVEIFVPLDTSRDYLFVEDAAAEWVEYCAALSQIDSQVVTRIFAAERSVTISEIVATFNRLLKKPLRLVCSRNALTAQYAQRVAFRSRHSLAISGRRHTLLEGAAKLLGAERLAYIAGSAQRTQ
jgi:UDP-glucose 4-epimerase